MPHSGSKGNQEPELLSMNWALSEQPQNVVSTAARGFPIYETECR